MQNLTAAGQEVSAALHELAARDPRFRKGMSRGKGGRGGRGGRGRGQVRRGAGFAEAPDLFDLVYTMTAVDLPWMAAAC